MVADEPQSLMHLASALETPLKAVRAAIASLVADFDGLGNRQMKPRIRRALFRPTHFINARVAILQRLKSCSQTLAVDLGQPVLLAPVRPGCPDALPCAGRT